MNNLALHILDIVQNSITASASEVQILIKESARENIYRITIIDNGRGMKKEWAELVTDPYTTSRKTRKVGLGLPLLKQNAESTGGFLRVESAEGKGTRVVAEFKKDHIDRPPAGDLPGILKIIVAGNPGLNLVYKHTTGKGTYMFDTDGVKKMLDNVPINEPKILQALKEMINVNLQEINAEE